MLKKRMILEEDDSREEVLVKRGMAEFDYD